MKDLLTQFSLSEILLFIVIFAIAVKGVVTFFDWAVDRLRKVFNKESKEQKRYSDIEATMQKILINQEQNAQTFDNINKTLDLLVTSDKDDIKSWITEKHHYFCYVQKHIDDYSLDCIEKRYGHYVDEKGNSFVADLMEDIRQLPKVSEIKK